jgi:RNA polymerase sigma factor (sigma-70 family)
MSGGDSAGSSLSAYLVEIGQHRLLTADEELRLAQQMSDGQQAAAALAVLSVAEANERADLERRLHLGARARDQLVVSNLRLVVSIARHYRGYGLSLLDVIQEGNIGLHSGIEKFEYTRGFRLSTYVVWWIRQSIVEALEKNSYTLHLPTRAAEVLRSAVAAEQDLERELARAPSVEEIAARLGISPDRLIRMRQASRPPVSLDAPVRNGSLLTLGDMIADDDASTSLDAASERAERSAQIADTIGRLPARERQVLELHYGLGQPHSWSLTQIATRLGVTRERARQLEYRALRRIRSDARVREQLSVFAER